MTQLALTLTPAEILAAEATSSDELPEDPIFGTVIHAYTREAALEDGALVDAQIGEIAEVTRQHFGRAPVFLTRALASMIERAVAHPTHHNDRRGVAHDVYTMASAYGLSKLPVGDTMRFRVIITGLGRRRYHTLAAGFDGEALTVGTPEDF